MDANDMADDAAIDGDLTDVAAVDDLPVVTTEAEAASSSSTEDDGGDVARDPDAIAQEIEQTRAELADTIDAIANRISPKKAAARGVQAVKSHVPGSPPDPSAPAPALGASPAGNVASSAPPVPAIAAIAGIVVLVLLLIRRRRRA
jgi:hypothetical protein